MSKRAMFLVCGFLCCLSGLAIGSDYDYTYDFGSAAVGSSSGTVPFIKSGVIFNDPDCSGSATTTPVTGADAADFVATGGCLQQTMGPWDVCMIPMVFKPSSPGPKSASATLSIYVNCGGQSETLTVLFSLIGTGTGAGNSNLGVFDPHAGVPSTLPPVVKSVTPSGTAASLSLTTQMKFDDSISGQQGSVFVGARVPPYATGNGLTGSSQPQSAAQLHQSQGANTETWYVSNGATWAQLGTTIPSVFSGTLTDANAAVNILNGANTAGLCGTEFYVGYGTDASSMLASNTMGKVYTVMCNYDFTASASGSTSNQNLSSYVQIATADAGKSGNFYVGRLMNNQWTLNNGSGWVEYHGGAVPVYSSGVLSSRQITVFNNENVQRMTGAQIFVGYGLNDADMLSNNKYKLVYTVP